MGAPQYEQAGADIGGTGTTNTIPRWTGPTTLGDSVITQSGAAGSENILISRAANASTSLLALTTSGGPAVDTLFLRGGTALNYFDFVRNVTTGALQIQGNQAGANNIALAPTGGSVGIGTGAAAPGRALHVQATGTNGIQLTSTGVCAARIQTDAGNALTFGLDGTVGNTERARIDSNGNIYGTSGTTGMTNGFFYIPAAAGAPTGTPTAVSGRVPMYYDTTNNQFYVYNGAWKKVTLA